MVTLIIVFNKLLLQKEITKKNGVKVKTEKEEQKKQRSESKIHRKRGDVRKLLTK